MTGILRRRFLRTAAALLLAGAPARERAVAASAAEPPGKPAKGDRCPVCGMFVARYPKWVARVVFEDGAVFFYDGAKDMFKHLFDVARYTPGRSAAEVVQRHVTDYYEVELVEATTALFVIGSDVLGPMGHELLPFGERAAAEEFLADHRGKAILRFDEVTPETIRSLDRRS